MEPDNKLTRIAVFYDGNFFSHVSNYYTYNHPRRARLGVHGLHNFIRAEVAKQESINNRYCQIVDAHYFRGRLTAREAESRNSLLNERLFDDVLIREGVVTHYLPLGPNGEKGIDVWLALEVLELAIYKHFNVSVIVTGDGDFVPLIRKLNTIGTRVMVLGWDFRFMGQDGKEHETRTSQQLLDEATYPIMMSDVIDDRSRKNDALVNGLFLSTREYRMPPAPQATNGQPAGEQPAVEQPAGEHPAGEHPATGDSTGEQQTGEQTPGEQPTGEPVNGNRTLGTIKVLKEGYGFIAPSSGSADLFFFHSEVLDVDFNDLVVGDRVSFTPGRNDRGACARDIQRGGA
jgi:cold shock CspA family protein